MATRRTSVPERIAGSILGLSTGDEIEDGPLLVQSPKIVEPERDDKGNIIKAGYIEPAKVLQESQSVLAKYFPELTLRLPAKGARGGRLGRAPQLAEQEIKYTSQEMVRAGAPVTNISVTTPTQQPVTQGPDYTGQIESLKQQLMAQSKQIEDLLKRPTGTAGTTGTTGTTTTPPTTEQQAKGEIEKLYTNLLGRKSDEEGLKYWMGEGRAAGGITTEEYKTLERDFMLSPEYNIKKLYKEELGRDTPDPEGLKYWTTQDPRSADRMITPQEYAELQQAFRATPEYQAKNTKTQTQAPLTSQATNTTAGNIGGTALSSPKPERDTESMKQELLSFAKQAAPTSEDRVRVAYREALGKEADPEGLRYWSSAGRSDTEYAKFVNQLRVAAGLA